MLIPRNEALYTINRLKSLLLNSQYYRFFYFTPIYLLLFGILFTSCSQEKDTFVSKNFHNTTAHYNAYFLAREKMKEVESQIWLNNVDDYNKILNIYPEISEATAKAIDPGVEEVIKKASLIPEKHKNSEWLDDAYTIIGKSYLYKKEYKTSLNFCKFVNSKSKDANARYAAVILLARTYIDSMDYQSAKSTIDYLNKKAIEEPMIKENLKDFLLLQAWYNQKMEEYDKMLPLLEKAVDLIPKKDIRARTHFIIGQLYQQQPNDTAAYKHYRAATKRNPPYELLFHAKLYLAQVSGAQNISERKMDKYFRKLLTDKKNEEYRDKIYYEMGNYEMKNKDVPEAIKNYQKSIRANKKNQPLKGLAYLKLGDIYYDQSDFERSKLYYDSTVANWNKSDKRYKGIASRQKILAEFSGYVSTVRREDSLQKLAKMPKEKLDQFISDLIIKEKERKIQEEEAKKNADLLAQNMSNAPNNTDELGGDNTSTFALTNSTAVATGRTAFKNVWGNRPLEDNWRRSVKEAVTPDETVDTATVDTAQIEKEPVLSTEDSLKMEQANREAYYKDIPFTQAQLDTSNKKIEKALFKIAQIYDQKLLEPKRAIENYERLDTRFPETEYKPESYYSLYLIFKKLNEERSAEKYKNKLLKEFPNSLYAKLLINPNYIQETKQANLKAHAQYKIAFELFREGRYKMVDSLIHNIKVEYPENDIEDKLSLLSILNFGQTGSPIKYNEMLKEFMDTNTGSPLAIKAKELLDASENYIKEQQEKGETVSTSDVKFSTNLEKPHIMVAVLPNNIAKNKVLHEFKSFVIANKESQNLTVDFKQFTDSTYIISVKGFEEKFPAQVFINKVKDEKSFYKKNGYSEQSVFIITNSNYQLLVESKNLPLYLKFYKDNY